MDEKKINRRLVHIQGLFECPDATCKSSTMGCLTCLYEHMRGEWNDINSKIETEEWPEDPEGDTESLRIQVAKMFSEVILAKLKSMVKFDFFNDVSGNDGT